MSSDGAFTALLLQLQITADLSKYLQAEEVAGTVGLVKASSRVMMRRCVCTSNEANTALPGYGTTDKSIPGLIEIEKSWLFLLIYFLALLPQ